MLMASPRDYVDALADLREADEHISKLGAQLRSFTERMLAFPNETCFDHVEGEPEPSLDQLIQGARWKAAEFPTAARLQAALRRRFEARQVALRIWADLTPFQRQGAPKVPA